MGKMFLISAIFILSLIPQLLIADIDTLWTAFGEGDRCFDVIEISNRNILAGGRSSHIGGLYLLETDENGELIFEKYYGDLGSASIRSIHELNNGNFMIFGSMGTFENNDIFVGKIDNNGDTLWIKTYGDSLFNFCSNAYYTNDSGYILSGNTETDSGSVYMLLKVDSIGNMQWIKTYMYGLGESVVQTNDGGYLVVGYGDYASMLLVDSLGNEITHINDGNEYYSVTKSIDGNYVAAGAKWHSYGEYYTLYIVKVDSELNLLNWKEYGAFGDWSIGYSIDNTSDGGYIIGGETGPALFYEDGYVLKVDADLEKQWDMTFDVPYTEVRIFSAHETSDGNYIAAGDNGDYAWLLKLGEVQDVVSGDSVNLPTNYLTLTSYPNPFNTSTEIRYYLPEQAEIKLEVFNLLGRRVDILYKGKKTKGYHSINWDAADYPSGIYFCKLISGGRSVIKKMILLK